MILTCFKDEADFQKRWDEDGPREKETVVSKGMSMEEAQRLVEQADYNPVAVAVQEAALLNSPLVDGKLQIHEVVLEMTLANQGKELTSAGRAALGNLFHIIPMDKDPFDDEEESGEARHENET